MPDITKDLKVNLVLPKLPANSRKHAFMILAKEISSQIPCSQHLLYERLMHLEHSASSGIGDGVAIPHMQMPQLEKPLTVLTTLKQPVAFHALDNKPVDLIFTLLSPEKDGNLHLRRLSRVSRNMRNPDLRQKLRETTDKDALRSLLIDPEGLRLAA